MKNCAVFPTRYCRPLPCAACSTVTDHQAFLRMLRCLTQTQAWFNLNSQDAARQIHQPSRGNNASLSQKPACTSVLAGQQGPRPQPVAPAAPGAGAWEGRGRRETSCGLGCVMPGPDWVWLVRCGDRDWRGGGCGPQCGGRRVQATRPPADGALRLATPEETLRKCR